jgi:hypothetical protein
MRGIEEIDAGLERLIHDLKAGGFIGELAKIHGAEYQPADLQARSAEMFVLQDRAPMRSGRKKTSFTLRRTFDLRVTTARGDELISSIAAGTRRIYVEARRPAALDCGMAPTEPSKETANNRRADCCSVNAAEISINVSSPLPSILRARD